ncbi:hypothetical protein [Patiriisocius sp. Uisw_047]|jgi:hypothetical protein|uniref:hypothetical protein n=1 Tax=Patiriisocius sp. Uisw_047 TaxID=3230969 RepID=UPI0039ED1251
MNIDTQTWSEFKNAFTEENSNPYYSILVILALTLLNWLLEIRKWKLVVSHLQTISFKTSLKQSLAALTASLATPARVGDYGAKAAYYPNEKRKQILLLNLFSNGMQMMVTAFFGMIGFCLVGLNYPLPVSTNKVGYILLGLFLSTLAVYFFRNKTLLIKGLSIKSVLTYFKGLSLKIKTGTALFSLLRYLVFSSLFVIVLVFFGAENGFVSLYIFIFTMYFFVSIIPSLFIFDVVIRSGVAVWLFSIIDVPEPTVLCTVLTMWLLNFVLPALIGSYFVMTFKPAESQ